MSEYFPSDILFQIFLNLPTKSLRRFLAVSKLWHSIITSNLFVSQHLIQPPHPQNNSFFFLETYYKNYISEKHDEFSYSLVQETHITETPNQEIPGLLEVPSQITYRPTGVNEKLEIVGIANGLIILIEDFKDIKSNTFLWNPAVDVFVKLPRPGIEWEWYDKYDFGFWFDSRNCDFKFMRIVYGCIEKGDLRTDSPTLAEVFSLNTGEWRRVNVDGFNNYRPTSEWSHVYMNERSHWIGYIYDIDYHEEDVIMSFDMNDEVFREITLPFTSDIQTYKLKITEMMGCLAVMWDDDRSGVCLLWVMKKYGDLSSWTNLYNIPIDTELNNYTFLEFWKNGDVLLIRDCYHIGDVKDDFLIRSSFSQLVRYVPGIELLEDDLDIVLGGLSSTRCSCAGKYEESLALLDLKFSGEWMKVETRLLVYQRS